MELTTHDLRIEYVDTDGARWSFVKSAPASARPWSILYRPARTHLQDTVPELGDLFAHGTIVSTGFPSLDAARAYAAAIGFSRERWETGS